MLDYIEILDIGYKIVRFSISYNNISRGFELGITGLTYDRLVDSIISNFYTNGKMQAVINNYLLDPSNEEAIAEFNEMQEFRAYAKEVAKEALAYIEENNL